MVKTIIFSIHSATKQVKNTKILIKNAIIFIKNAKMFMNVRVEMNGYY